MTGLAVLVGTAFWADEYPFQLTGSWIESMCVSWRDHLAIGWERFIIDAGTHKKTRQPEAMEIIGVARYFAARYGCQILTPADPHTPDKADQAALKALGWWVPGKNDAQSAAAHLLNWLIRANCLPAEYATVLAGLR